MMALCTSQIYHSYVDKGWKRELVGCKNFIFWLCLDFETSVHLLLVCICNFKDMIPYAHQQNKMLCYKLPEFQTHWHRSLVGPVMLSSSISSLPNDGTF